MCVCTATTNGQTRQTSCLSPLSQQHVRRVILIIISQLLLLHCYNLYYSAFLAKKKSSQYTIRQKYQDVLLRMQRTVSWFNAADFDINRCPLVVQEEHISSHGVVIFKLAPNLCWADIKSAQVQGVRIKQPTDANYFPVTREQLRLPERGNRAADGNQLNLRLGPADPKRKRLAKVIGVSESPLCSWLLTVFVV